MSKCSGSNCPLQYDPDKKPPYECKSAEECPWFTEYIMWDPEWLFVVGVLCSNVQEVKERFEMEANDER